MAKGNSPAGGSNLFQMVGQPLDSNLNTTSGRSRYSRKPGSGRAWIGGGTQGFVPFMPLPMGFQGTYKDWLERHRALAEARPKSVAPKNPAPLPFKPPDGPGGFPDGTGDDGLAIVPDATDTGLYVDPDSLDYLDNDITAVRPPGVNADLLPWNPYPYIPPVEDDYAGDAYIGPGQGAGQAGGRYANMTDKAWKCMTNPSLPECEGMDVNEKGPGSGGKMPRGIGRGAPGSGNAYQGLYSSDDIFEKCLKDPNRPECQLL